MYIDVIQKVKGKRVASQRLCLYRYKSVSEAKLKQNIFKVHSSPQIKIMSGGGIGSDGVKRLSSGRTYKVCSPGAFFETDS